MLLHALTLAFGAATRAVWALPPDSLCCWQSRLWRSHSCAAGGCLAPDAARLLCLLRLLIWLLRLTLGQGIAVGVGKLIWQQKGPIESNEVSAD